MITNRTVKIVLCQVLALAILGLGMAPNGFAKDPEATQDLELLFIQNATSGTFDGKKLVLKEVGPTIFFADRPHRVEGHMRTEIFVEEWKKGADSFADDPPNAALSILDENAVKSIVVELFDPILDGATLSYRVKVLQGKIPPTFKMASLFIDHLRRPGAFIGAALIGGVIGCSEEAGPSPATPANGPAPSAAGAAQDNAAAYPIDFCVVSGEKLGSMGDAIEVTVEGRTVMLCCEMCKTDLMNDPSVYLAKLDAAAAGDAGAPASEAEHGSHQH